MSNLFCFVVRHYSCSWLILAIFIMSDHNSPDMLGPTVCRRRYADTCSRRVMRTDLTPVHKWLVIVKFAQDWGLPSRASWNSHWPFSTPLQHEWQWVVFSWEWTPEVNNFPFWNPSIRNTILRWALCEMRNSDDDPLQTLHEISYSVKVWYLGINISALCRCSNSSTRSGLPAAYKHSSQRGDDCRAWM